MADISPIHIENVLQEALDNLAEISETVIRTQDVNLILHVQGLVKTTGTMIKIAADELGLDVEVKTPIDLGGPDGPAGYGAHIRRQASCVRMAGRIQAYLPHSTGKRLVC